MTKNIAIIGANGAIARLVEQRLLSENKNMHLTLFLRNSGRLANLKNNPKVTIVDGDANNEDDLKKAIKGQDLVYVSFVDHDANAAVTKNIIKIMDEGGR